MKKHRVLIVENSIDLTGGLNSILRSSHLLSDSFDFHFLVPQNCKCKNFISQQGFAVYTLPMMELRKSLRSLLLYIPYLLLNTIRFWRICKQVSIDLIVSNDSYNLIPPLYRMFGGVTPYLTYVRFRPSKFPILLTRMWWLFHSRFASKIIAVSEVVKRELPTSNKVIVVYNEIPNKDVEFTKPTKDVILYPSNYTPGKGHEAALRAFERVNRRIPGWTLKFIGGTLGLKKNEQYKDWLINLGDQLKLNAAVEWMDFAEDVGKEYQNASIVLNFSESESFSLTCLEAMYYGRALIATKSGGPEELIVNEISGILVDIHAHDQMEAALHKLMTNNNYRDYIAFSAYNQTRKKFNLKDLKIILKKIYSDVVGYH